MVLRVPPRCAACDEGLSGQGGEAFRGGAGGGEAAGTLGTDYLKAATPWALASWAN